MAEITVKIGKKLGRKKIDLSNAVQGRKPAQDKGTAGQAEHWVAVVCPVCYAVNYGWIDTEKVNYFFCWNSCNYFEV